MAVAFGGYALVGNSATPQTVNLASAANESSQGVTVHACLASGKLTQVSLAAALRVRGEVGPAPLERAGPACITTGPTACSLFVVQLVAESVD